MGVGLAVSFWLPPSATGGLALASVVVYRSMFSISMGPLPYIITAEIFPTHCRAAGVSLCWCLNWIANYFVSQTFLLLIDGLTTSGTFLLYATICVFTICFIRVCVPETSGKTLEQLQAEQETKSSYISS